MYSKYLSKIEYWKEVDFKLDFEPTNQLKLEVSNFGRLRTFHKLSNGNIIKGSTTEGYPVYKTRFYKPRDAETQKKIDHKKAHNLKLEKKIWAMKRDQVSLVEINEAEIFLKKLRQNLTKYIAKETKERTVHYSVLIHRLVAQYFLPKNKTTQVFVAHLDFNKKNNSAYNLQWMTKEANELHQQKSPAVKAYKKTGNIKFNNSKLTELKVMLIKKYINQNKKSKAIAKQFKVSDMQIHRIKTGENWGSVKAAT